MVRIDSSQSGSVVITYPKDAYIFQPLQEATERHLGQAVKIFNTLEEANESKDNAKIVHIGEYEDLDHERLMTDPSHYMANSYIYRKSLIRKNYLSNTIKIYTSKNPTSILCKSFPESYNLELDYAEFLDDSLDEVYELKCELMENEQRSGSEQKTYILKPSMSDKGQGIRIFKTIDQLQDIFNSFEEDDTDDEDYGATSQEADGNGIITSQLRHFVVQDYINDPLLLSQYDDRKFHIRCYVLCSNNLTVYVYKRMLMLFSESKYIDPSTAELDDEGVIPMDGHLTNTCLQRDEKTVIEFGKSCLDDEIKTKIESQIFEIVEDLFKAAINVDKINFQPLPNAFEIYGLDFLVDSKLNVSLLEVNAYPDFKQTGDDLKGLIYELFDGVVKTSIKPFLQDDKSTENNETQKTENLENINQNLHKVLSVDNNY
ncbi:unnamed protein product [Ambrosiozyma monospora]|uniref:Unnamed protein product n=1 Tax=Ambrosiozyma monospora TaxID=43982 RepID=A0A9W6YSL2_AMBMO|nr:unnamed protein product [Ambrosiozyma monospora]